MIKEKFSLVIPTYDEAKNIGNLCMHLLEILKGNDLNFEIIIVDDNSQDGTWQIVQELSRKENSIKVIRRTNERSLSSAVLCGWGYAGGDILGVIDGDFQHPPELIPKMIRRLLEDKETDIVIASRNVKGGGVSKWSLFRRFISCSGILISRFFLSHSLAQVKDSMSGYFILRREVIDGKLLTPVGYKILLEVLVKGNYKKIEEIPYVFQERRIGGSKADLRQYLTSLRHILSLSIQTRQINNVIKYIVILFAILILFSWILFIIGK